LLYPTYVIAEKIVSRSLFEFEFEGKVQRR